MGERKGTKALELWCKRLVRDCPIVQIENMTTSWRNGMAFCALVHHFRPDLIDMSTLSPENIYENNQLAFSIAEKHLGIPALLDPEDMVANDVPDRLSILTYLSQFYQRLGHTVTTKSNDSESSQVVTQSTVVEKFGKSALDKCASCDLPVYLAQRLIVSQKLYHRRCFRCSKCSGHLNQNNFKNYVGTDFTCDSCRNNKTLSKYLNNNDVQMGMLEFTDNLHQGSTGNIVAKPLSDARRQRPQSILDKINMFEKPVNNSRIDDKLDSLTLKDDINPKNSQDFSSLNLASTSQVTKNSAETLKRFPVVPIMKDNKDIFTHTRSTENVYKSDILKNSFLKSQLLDDTETDAGNGTDLKVSTLDSTEANSCDISTEAEFRQECNVTDDTRLANNGNPSTASLGNGSTITIPPRRKKRPSTDAKITSDDEKTRDQSSLGPETYPDHLNPFSEDEEEDGDPVNPKSVSTNPFSSSDDEEETPPVSVATKSQADCGPPVKRLIAANPFWSDGEEPTTDEEEYNSTSMSRSSVMTSTPNRQSTPQRRKVKAPPPPPPPPPPTVLLSLAADRPSESMEDVASLSSVSSFNSTVHSDQKSHGKLTPMLKKRRPAPTPPDSISTMSSSSLHGGGGSMDQGVDTSGLSRRSKGPAPGLPLPERRAVKLQLSPAELQIQLDLLETQQLGLEKQGVLIEQMIRDKCEGDEPSTAPQEEVEDLVIQLCELVNEKNDLFRKQTELMYIRRQQRLEQEQADIEHEIRVIQSRPAVNRIDADKAREEQLVSRLVEIVRLRDELVQQLDAERRRERQEDLAIAASIATKRAQRHNESNSSSMKSEVVAAPKKNKVKDKMKKQFKKAKHTLISKKKDGSSEKKQEEKEKKSKTSPKNKTEV